jgi:hypothetical protein
MPDNGKQTVRARTESHSDVSTEPAARTHQSAMTERQFGAALLKSLRAVEGEVLLRNFQEEWISTEDGMAHEISVELHPAEA